MAEITWQNVNAPSNDAVFRGMILASSNLNDASKNFQGAGEGLLKANQTAMDQSDAAKALQIKAALVNATTPEEYKAAVGLASNLTTQFNSPKAAGELLTSMPTGYKTQQEALQAGHTAQRGDVLSGIEHKPKVDQAVLKSKVYFNDKDTTDEAAFKTGKYEAGKLLNAADANLTMLPIENTTATLDHSNKIMKPYFDTSALNATLPQYGKTVTANTQYLADIAEASAGIQAGHLDAQIQNLKGEAANNIQKGVYNNMVNAAGITNEQAHNAIIGAANEAEASASETKLKKSNADTAMGTNVTKQFDNSLHPETKFKEANMALSNQRKELTNALDAMPKSIDHKGITDHIKVVSDFDPSSGESMSALENIQGAIEILNKDYPDLNIQDIPVDAIKGLVDKYKQDGAIWKFDADLSKDIAADLLIQANGPYKDVLATKANDRQHYTQQVALMDEMALKLPSLYGFKKDSPQPSSETKEAPGEKLKATAKDVPKPDAKTKDQISEQAIKEALPTIPTTKLVPSIRGVAPTIVKLTPDELAAARLKQQADLAEKDLQQQKDYWYNKNQAESDVWMKAYNDKNK